MTGIITDNLGRSGGLVKAVAAGGGGAWNIIGTVVASDDASLTITGLDSTYDTYCIIGSDILPATDNVELWFQLGDSSGIDSGSADYKWNCYRYDDGVTNAAWEQDTSDPYINISGNPSGALGGAAGEGLGFTAFLYGPGDSDMYSHLSWQMSGIYYSTMPGFVNGSGFRSANIAHDRCLIYFESGNVESGRLTVWGIAHV